MSFTERADGLIELAVPGGALRPVGQKYPINNEWFEVVDHLPRNTLLLRRLSPDEIPPEGKANKEE
jgi:hypothetical protein